jgi:hypothetical protein
MMMNCDQIIDALESLSGCEELPDQVLVHAKSCVACKGKLARARNLVTLIRKLPVPAAPPGLRSRVLGSRVSASVPRGGGVPAQPIYRRRLVRVAAAAILLVGVSAAFLVERDPALSYQPLELTVLPMAENGPSDEEFALEVMYGPGIPIGEFQESEGTGGDDAGSANDR